MTKCSKEKKKKKARQKEKYAFSIFNCTNIKLIQVSEGKVLFFLNMWRYGFWLFYNCASSITATDPHVHISLSHKKIIRASF